MQSEQILERIRVRRIREHDFWPVPGIAARLSVQIRWCDPALDLENVSRCRHSMSGGLESVPAAAFSAHPECFMRGAPHAPRVPEAAWINKPNPISSNTETSAPPQEKT